MPEYIYGEEVDYEFGLLKDSDVESYMETEQNMEINENIPMYMKL